MMEGSSGNLEAVATTALKKKKLEAFFSEFGWISIEEMCNCSVAARGSEMTKTLVACVEDDGKESTSYSLTVSVALIDDGWLARMRWC